MLSAGDKYELCMASIPKGQIDADDPEWGEAELKEWSGIKDIVEVVYSVPRGEDIVS